jgi:hypothetical protein
LPDERQGAPDVVVAALDDHDGRVEAAQADPAGQPRERAAVPGSRVDVARARIGADHDLPVEYPGQIGRPRVARVPGPDPRGDGRADDRQQRPGTLAGRGWGPRIRAIAARASRPRRVAVLPRGARVLRR